MVMHVGLRGVAQVGFFALAAGVVASAAQADPLYFPQADPSLNQEWRYGEFVDEANGDVEFEAEDVSEGGTYMPGVADRHAAVWQPGVGVVVLDIGDASAWRDFFDLPAEFEQFFDIPDWDNFSHASDITADAQWMVGGVEFDGPGAGYWWMPLLWQADGAGWKTAVPLPLIDSTAPSTFYSGDAEAISDQGAFVAGFGEIITLENINSGGNETTTPSARTALRWRRQPDGSYVPELPDVSSSPSDYAALGSQSVALDVNEAGTAVGSYGDPDSLAIRPFVWVDGGTNTIVALDTPIDADNEAFEGEARAVSEGDKTIVGWVKETDEPEMAAAWTNRHDYLGLGVVAPNAELVLLREELRTGTSDPTLDFREISSRANAVDVSGRLIVGKGTYLIGYGGEYDRALFWELDEDFGLVGTGGRFVQDALGEAGVPMGDAEFTLTEATGVRTVIDEETGKPSEIYVVGTGEGSFGSWIAALAGSGPAGLTTPPSLVLSTTVAPRAGDDIAGRLGSAADWRCNRPDGQPVDEAPWCFFVAGMGGAYLDQGSNGAEIGKHIGLARYFDEDTSIGASIGLDYLTGSVQGGSNYRALTGQISAYAAHEPDEGVRGSVSVALGSIVDATFERVYVNGAGTASSTGATRGYGVAVGGELGYGVALDDATRLIPFVRGRLTQVGLDGWSDTGGPFNAAIDPVRANRATLTGGVRVEHDLSGTERLLAGIDWSAIYQSGSGVGATIAGTRYAANAPAGWWGVGTASLGMEVDLDESSRIAGMINVSSDLVGYLSGSAAASYNLSF